MSTSRTWHRKWPEPHVPDHTTGHTVCFYRDEEELLDRLTRYAIQGADQGQRLVLFADHSRVKALRMRLAGWELSHVVDGHDATWGLSQFMTDDGPDRARFRGMLDRLLPNGPVGVRLYGEMVAVLWARGDVTSALSLEDLWNEYLEDHPAPLLCAYPHGDVQGSEHRNAVCTAHDHVFPSLAS